VVGSCATQSCAYLSRVHDSMTLGQPGFVICEHATMQDYLAWNVEKISDMFGKKRVTGPSLNQHSYIYFCIKEINILCLCILTEAKVKIFFYFENDFWACDPIWDSVRHAVNWDKLKQYEVTTDTYIVIGNDHNDLMINQNICQTCVVVFEMKKEPVAH